MKKLLLLSLVIFLFSCNSDNSYVAIKTEKTPSTTQLMEYWNNAYEALNDSNYADYLTYAEKVYSFAPNDFSFKILFADALMSENQSKKAEEVLKSAINLHSHLTYERLKQDQYQFIKKLDKFENYLTIALKDTEPINNSTIAFILEEKDL